MSLVSVPRPRPNRIVAAVSVAVVASALTGCGRAAPAGGRAATAGPMTVTVTGLELTGGGEGRGYVAFHNRGRMQLQVRAATSPQASSVTWTTAHQTLSLGDLFVAGPLCEDSAHLAAEAQKSARALHSLVIDPGTTVTLDRHTGAFLLHGLPASLHHDASVPLTIYLSDGHALTATLPVL